MTGIAGLAAAATLLSMAFAFTTAERWLDRRRPHEAAWTISLAMFALAAAAFFWAQALGWTSLNFRIFYLFGAILNVPWLALGTVWLLGSERTARIATVALSLISPFCAGVVLATPLRRPVPTTGLPEGRELFGPAARVMAAVGSGVGATVVLVGAGLSAWRWWRASRRTTDDGPSGTVAARLAITNVMISAGTLALGGGGAVAGAGARTTAFAITLLVGIALLFGGFLVSSRRGPAAGRDGFIEELRLLAVSENPTQHLAP